MCDGLYMDCEYTDYDVAHSNDPILTYDKDAAEKWIALMEKITHKKLSDNVKDRIRKRYRYIGDDAPPRTDIPVPTEAEINSFRNYVSSFKWTNAKTFEKFAPHEYILNFPCWKLKEDKKCDGESEACVECKVKRDEFVKQVLFIRNYGERCKMQNKVYTVYCLDGRQYWTMGDAIYYTWVLNRALIDEPRRIPKLEWLDRIDNEEDSK